MAKSVGEVEGGRSDQTTAPNASQTPPCVELRSVTKLFGDFTAVDDLSLAVPEGDFFTLLGPSGCGKTTTLRMVAGFEEATEGRVLIDDDDVAGVPPYKRPTNTVFQSYALFPHLNVKDNVAFGLKRQKVDGAEISKRVDRELERVGLAAEGNRRPAQLSGGQQQRVALARALVNLPKVLLLDEPTRGIDVGAKLEVYELINRLTGSGKAIVLVSSELGELIGMSDRILMLCEGRIGGVFTRAEATQERLLAAAMGRLGQAA